MIFGFGDVEVDGELLELRRGGEPIAIQPQVFALLMFLIETRDRVATKDEIIDAVWDGRAVSDGTLNARINALRTALGDDGKTQAVIRTFPRRGFRLMAEVEGRPGEAVTGAKPAPPGNGAISIAVLPFENFSNDPDQGFFADGLTEDLITDLSKNRNLHVVARHSSFAYRGRSLDLREVGQALGVDFLIEGSARKVGPKIRINAQMVEAKDGHHIWAERYDRDFGDIFSLQDEIVGKIVDALQVSLGATDRKASIRYDPAAYELFLKARSLFYAFSAEAFEEVGALCRQAQQLDPTFGEAWAAQVFSVQSGCSFFYEGFDDGYERALELGRKGIELSPDSAFCQGRFAWVNLLARNYSAAERHFDLAISLDPNNVEILGYLGEAQNFLGDPERAIGYVDQALRFEPVIPPNCAYHKGHSLFLLSRLDEALPHIQHCIDVAPLFPPANLTMAANLAELDRLDEARACIDRLLKNSPRATLELFEARYPYRNQKTMARMVAALGRAGLS